MTNEDRYLRVGLRYRLETPMRIGHRKSGNLQTTRYFVPGIAMWASTVNRLVNLFAGMTPRGENPYLFWGRFLQTQTRFSCLFLSHPQAGDQHRHLLPADPERWEDVLLIEREYLGGSVHAAIDHQRLTAEEGLLHEMEWIMPRRRSGGQVLLAGWVDVRLTGCTDRAEQPIFSINKEDGSRQLALGGRSLPLEEILGLATIGADLNNGRGRMSLDGAFEQGQVDATELFGSNPVPGWLSIKAGEVKGKIEAVTGRTWLPMDDSRQVSHGKPGGFPYSFLTYLPGGYTSQELRMDSFGQFFPA